MEASKQAHSNFRPLPRPINATSLSLEYLLEVIDLYNELLREYRELDRRTTEREKRYRGLKKSLRDWDEYFKRKRQSTVAGHESHPQPVTPRMPDTSPLAEGMTTPRARPVESITTHQPPFPSRLRNITHATAAAGTASLADGPRPRSLRTESPNPRITSSQSTEGAFSSSQLQPSHEEDDSPVVVSARSLKRKRASATRKAAEQVTHEPDSTPECPLPVKEENRSSPTVDRIPQPRLTRNGTLDLDAPVVVASTKLSDPDSENIPPSRLKTERCNLDHASARGPQSAPLGLPTPEEHGDGTDDEMLDCDITPDTKASSKGKVTPKRLSAGPLHALNSNTPVLPRTTAVGMSSVKSSRKPHDRVAAAVHILSEDGCDPDRSAKRPRTSASESTPKTSAAYRLDTLLEGSAKTPTRPIISPRPNPSLRKSREQAEPLPKTSIQPPLARSRRVVRDRVSPNPPHLAEDDPGPVRPEHEPLRSRPLHRLNIDDFRVDPNINEQRGYAYNETVRKKQERRCLPACTKDCCRSFRQMAAAGMLPSVKLNRGLFDDLDADIDDDELTLQGYLGRGYAQIIHNASPEEKSKMLIDARAQAFADQHGKHRQAFERRHTPPGFWRTDMPTTQEEEQDREEAMRMERQRVEERWREAMRGGGRYIFRDE